MTTGAILISWGAPVRGRERKGLDVFGRAVAYYDELAKEGRIHSHREFFRVTGGGPAGFMIVEGDLEELMAIETEDAVMTLKAESQQIVEAFETCVYAGGSDAAIGEMVANYMGTLDRLEL